MIYPVLSLISHFCPAESGVKVPDTCRGLFTHTLGSPADIVVIKDTEGDGKFKYCKVFTFAFSFVPHLLPFFLQLFLESILENILSQWARRKLL